MYFFRAMYLILPILNDPNRREHPTYIADQLYLSLHLVDPVPPVKEPQKYRRTCLNTEIINVIIIIIYF